jgi:hypothetical protein
MFKWTFSQRKEGTSITKFAGYFASVWSVITSRLISLSLLTHVVFKEALALCEFIALSSKFAQYFVFWLRELFSLRRR